MIHAKKDLEGNQIWSPSKQLAATSVCHGRATNSKSQVAEYQRGMLQFLGRAQETEIRKFINDRYKRTRKEVLKNVFDMREFCVYFHDVERQ